jgi:hypothetical protein
VRTGGGRRGAGNATVIEAKFPGALLNHRFHRDGDRARLN